MSFSIQGVSNLNTQIEQVRSNLNMRDKEVCNTPSSILAESVSRSLGVGNEACATQGAMSRPELNAQIITNTLDRLNQPQPWQSTRNAMQETYSLTKEIVGGFVDIRM